MNLIQNLISDELIYALGWTMVHSLWQGILVAFLMYIVLYFLQDKSAKLRYEVAAISLFGLFILSLCTFLLFFESTDRTPLEFILMEYSGKAFHQPTAFWHSYKWSATQYFNQQLPLMVTLWFLGVAFFVLRLVGGLVFIQKLKHQQNRPLEIKWQRKLQHLLAKLPIIQKVRLRESALINVPMIVGYFKPMILLPIGAVNSLSEQEVEAVLAHELAHVFRNDYIINIVLSFIEVLFYYHPAVWIISSNIRNERENCADDLAIELCGNSLTYAKALVSLEELNPTVPVFAMPFSGQKNQLMQRIKRILNQPQNGSDILEKISASGLILLAILLLSFSSGKTTNVLANSPFKTIIENSTPFHNQSTIKSKPSFPIKKQRFIPARDTFPKTKKRKQTIHHSDDNRSIELEINGNEVTKLKIDGKLIPREQYESYELEINELRASVPPAPPAPPRPNFPGRLEPPVPPVAPFPPSGKSVKILTHDERENGQTVIVIDGDDGPMEISINADNSVYIDGQNIEPGDSIIIVDEVPRRSFQYSTHSFPQGGNIDFAFPKTWTHDLQEELKSLQEENLFSSEERREELEQKMEELRILQEERREEFMVIAEEAKARAAEVREEALIRAQVAREEAMARMEASREIAEERREEAMARAEESRAHAEERREEAERQRIIHTNQHEELIDELIQDGYLKKGADDYSIRFNTKRMKVNGKTLPNNLYEKYLRLFGNDGKNFNIHIEKH